MSARKNYLVKHSVRQAKGQNTRVSARARKSALARARRTNLGHCSLAEPFAPPEDWYEPRGDGGDYRIIVQPPGKGFRHVVTPDEIRQRLSEVPPAFLKDLETVQLSRVTRKKQSFPCYGMQWGTTLYLYPLEESMTEYFYGPPRPSLINEVKMYGGRWKRPGPNVWALIWSADAARDFYLNNILIHELGHLVDERNDSYTDRERYAEWFAIEYGYRRSSAHHRPSTRCQVRRRHHAC
jgi:hypothetical protein